MATNVSIPFNWVDPGTPLTDAAGIYLRLQQQRRNNAFADRQQDAQEARDAEAQRQNMDASGRDRSRIGLQERQQGWNEFDAERKWIDTQTDRERAARERITVLSRTNPELARTIANNYALGYDEGGAPAPAPVAEPAMPAAAPAQAAPTAAPVLPEAAPRVQSEPPADEAVPAPEAMVARPGSWRRMPPPTDEDYGIPAAQASAPSTDAVPTREAFMQRALSAQAPQTQSAPAAPVPRAEQPPSSPGRVTVSGGRLGEMSFAPGRGEDIDRQRLEAFAQRFEATAATDPDPFRRQEVAEVTKLMRSGALGTADEANANATNLLRFMLHERTLGDMANQRAIIAADANRSRNAMAHASLAATDAGRRANLEGRGRTTAIQERGQVLAELKDVKRDTSLPANRDDLFKLQSALGKLNDGIQSGKINQLTFNTVRQNIASSLQKGVLSNQDFQETVKGMGDIGTRAMSWITGKTMGQPSTDELRIFAGGVSDYVRQKALAVQRAAEMYEAKWQDPGLADFRDLVATEYNREFKNMPGFVPLDRVGTTGGAIGAPAAGLLGGDSKGQSSGTSISVTAPPAELGGAIDEAIQGVDALMRKKGAAGGGR